MTKNKPFLIRVFEDENYVTEYEKYNFYLPRIGELLAIGKPQISEDKLYKVVSIESSFEELRNYEQMIDIIVKEVTDFAQD